MTAIDRIAARPSFRVATGIEPDARRGGRDPGAWRALAERARRTIRRALVTHTEATLAPYDAAAGGAVSAALRRPSRRRRPRRR